MIRIRNFNGYSALDLAKQLGNRELVNYLTHYLAYAEQNTLKSIKRNKLDPRYADSQWLLKQHRYWRPDWLDYSPYSKNYPPYNNLYWATSRSMESLSTKDDFDEDNLKMIANHDKKPLKDSRRLENVGLVKAIKNKDKALTNQVEIEKVLSGYNHLNRLDRLNLRRKLEEERLNRAMSMYNLTSRKYYDDHPYNPWMIRDDESVTSSMIFDYDLQNNIKKMHKQRLYPDTLNRKPTTDQHYLDQLMLNDNMFHNEPYSDLWEKETLNWFHKQKNNAHRESAESKHHSKSNQANPTNLESSNQNVQHQNVQHQNINQNNSTSSTTLPRRQSKMLDEQQLNAEKQNKQANFKLPPMPKHTTQDYETWLMQQRADEGSKK